MKAISIKQPWASLIINGIKHIENRTWKCPSKYIGQRVLIHASKDKSVGWKLNSEQELVLRNSGSGLWNVNFHDLPFCSIIGSIKIVDCIQNHPSVWAEKGVYNWVLDEPIIYEPPIEDVKGKLSFWDYNGIEEVVIECPECGTIQTAVADYTTVPFNTYIHNCKHCGFIIMEQDWCEVNEDKK